MREFPGFSRHGTHRWRPIPANSRAAEGPMRIFPGLSRSGKCDSREQSESERRRSVATFADTHSSAYGYAVQPAMRIACGSSGRMAFFPGFSRSGKCDSRGGESPTLTLQQATACLLSVLSSDSSSALRENRRFSPASAGVELTAPETCAAECIWDVPMSLKPFLLADSVPGSAAACTDKSHTAGLRPASAPKRCAARLA